MPSRAESITVCIGVGLEAAGGAAGSRAETLTGRHKDPGLSARNRCDTILPSTIGQDCQSRVAGP